MQKRLYEKTRLRDLDLRNRIVIPPMCQYSAEEGAPGDYHLVHYGRLALGGAGLVIVEATAVVAEGRITHGDLGLWNDAQEEGFARVARFIKSTGAAAGVQLAHAGRKASTQKPWDGAAPLSAADAARGEAPWPASAPSAIAMDQGWPTPNALTAEGLAQVKAAFVAAAQRADRAGYDVIEVHCAHGYLLHSFLSPVTNQRDDSYGGDRARRMAFPLEVARALRAAWPQGKPMFVRVSAVDGVEGGQSVEDTIAYAVELKRLGVDVVDCSSGGLVGPATAARIHRDYGFQTPFSERIRREAGIATMAVGLIVDHDQAEQILARGQADFIGVGRAALHDPNWPAHGQDYAQWPQQAGWSLERRQPDLDKLGPWKAA